MNEQKFNRQEMYEYLLGALPEAETERFDELSFTNDEFSDTLAAAEKDLIDAYIHGELTGATLEKFESYYLASPLRRAKVEFAKSFQIYAQKNVLTTGENDISEKAAPVQESARFWSLLNIFKTRKFLLQTSFAAALLLLIVGVFWTLNRQSDETARQNSSENRNRQLPNSIENNQPPSPPTEKEIAAANPQNKTSPEAVQEPPKKTPPVEPTQTPTPEKIPTPPKLAVASFLLTPSLRSAGQVKSISIPKETVEINMNLQLEANDYSAYRVALADQSGSVNLWQSGRLKAAGKDGNARITIRFPAKLLKSQIYTLVVSGINPNGEAEIISSYPFRSVLK